MAISCGHCKGRHETVSDVRLCGTGASAVTVTATLPRPKEKISVTEGLYFRGGKPFKVVTSRSSGHLYAKVLVPPRSPGGKGRWELAKGMVFQLDLSDAMTPEQAAEFGALYGVCCNCDRELSREESKRRGYGPTCADNLGWPYDHNAD